MTAVNEHISNACPYAATAVANITQQRFMRDEQALIIKLINLVPAYVFALPATGGIRLSNGQKDRGTVGAY
jgi:hypothetical protein